MIKRFTPKAVTIAVAMALGSVPAIAAEAQTEAQATEKKIEQIAVVGSRGAPRSVAESAVPIDIIGGEDLARSGNTDMLELLKGAVPSLNAHTNPISDAASLIRPANLRGLSADSTLVLVNGKRRHRASVITFLGGGINDGSQGPDISVIPSIALKQVEVLRDGAAAQYGSDAIAGVMNFVLKDNDDGGSFEVRTGEYYEGDGASTQIAGNIGMPFTENGFANVSFQLKNADATSRSEQRPDAQAFIDAGNTAVAPIAQIWGSPEVKDDITIFGNVGLDLGNDKEFYMFGNYSERDVRGGFYYRNPHSRGGVYSNDDGATLLIGDLTPGPVGQVNDGFLGTGDGIDCPTIAITSANVLNQQDYIDGVQNDPNCFSFNETHPGGFTPNFGGNITDTSLTIGTKGEYQDISYDISGSVGRNESKYVIYNTVNASMGPESPSDFNPGKYIQLEKNFNLDLLKTFDLGLYDDVYVAGGLEWHEETFSVVNGDPASFEVGPLVDQGFGIGSNGFPGFQPSQAGDFTRRNAAVYVEVEASYTEDFMMGYALRYEDYATFGSTVNYKISGQYSFSDDLSLRASTSTGFRAPTVGQANVSNVSTNLSNGVLVDSALLPPTNPISQQLGGTELTPEESTSYAMGLVYNYDDLFITLDYYNIEVTDRISQSNNVTLTDADKTALTAAGVANVDSIAQVRFFTNDFDTTTQGIDLVVNYEAETFGGDTKYSLAYNWNETKVDNFSDITGDFKVKRLEEDLPQHRGTFTISQSWADVDALVRANYYGEYQGVHVDYDLTAKTASASVTVDAEVTYHVNDSISLTLGAQNLLDQEAEKIDFSGASNTWGGKYYETSPYGFNGGYYYLSAKYNF